MLKIASHKLKIIDEERQDWKSLYWIAGIGVLMTVGLIFIDIYMSLTGGDIEVGSLSAVGWFEHLRSDWFVGLRNLGVFNVLNPLLTLPLYLVIFNSHRRMLPWASWLMLTLFGIGTAVYIANNGALAMLSLSNQYFASVSPAERSLLEAAGTVIVARSEDFTPGTFPGFLLLNLSSLLLMGVMVKGQLFSKWMGLAGLLASTLLTVFTVISTFSPMFFSQAMLLAMIGGVFMLIWNIWISISMFRLCGQM